MNINPNIIDGAIGTFLENGRRITGRIRRTGPTVLLNFVDRYGRTSVYRLSPNAVFVGLA